MRKSEKWIIVILTMITLGAIGTAVYFGIHDDCETKTTETNKTPENKQDAKELCKENLDKIYDAMVKMRKESFLAKYYPNDFKEYEKEYPLPSKENVCLNTSFSEGDYELNIPLDETGMHFIEVDTIYGIATEHMDSSAIEGSTLVDTQEAYLKAVSIISKDLENSSYKDYGTYPYGFEYFKTDSFIIEIRDYLAEEDLSGKLYATYVIDFNTKTFQKVLAK